MSESHVQVNDVLATDGPRLKTFETTDGNHIVVQAQAIVATDPTGAVLNQATEETLLGISMSLELSGILELGAEQPVTSAAAVLLLSTNSARRGFTIQNNGAGNIRVGPIGVTATTGLRLLPDAIMTGSPPFLPINALYAIAETVDSIVFASEIV